MAILPTPKTGAKPLVKQLVAAGVGSRRRSAALIMQGVVSVNGKQALDLNRLVAPGDSVQVNGATVGQADDRRVYLVLNKPRGYLSAVTDARGRPTVLDLVPPALRVTGLVPAGRLDLYSAGLLLLTNDGALVNRVTHPRYGVEKEYDVLVDRTLSAGEQRRLLSGIEIEGGIAAAVAVESFKGTEARYRVVLVEGKKREVRLMMAGLGRSVLRLTRVRIGGLRLGALSPGSVRRLTESEAMPIISGEAPAEAGRQRPGSGRPPTSRSPAGRPPAGRPAASGPPASGPPASRPPTSRPAASRAPASRPAASRPPTSRPRCEPSSLRAVPPRAVLLRAVPPRAVPPRAVLLRVILPRGVPLRVVLPWDVLRRVVLRRVVLRRGVLLRAVPPRVAPLRVARLRVARLRVARLRVALPRGVPLRAVLPRVALLPRGGRVANSGRLVWIDMEMTGLDPERHVVIEIATLVTDGDLNVLAEGPVIPVARSREEMERIDEWSLKTHTGSGLLERVGASTVDVAEAERRTLDFVKEWVGPREAPLCGNSVHQDRLFLMKEMKTLEAYLQYRIVDVSSVKELVRRWYPGLRSPVKKGAHRALDDIRESIEELRFYRERVFVARSE